MSAEGLEIIARADVAIAKPHWQQEFSSFTRAQTKMLISAAAVLGAAAAKEFAVEVISTIRQPCDDDTFKYALKQLLAEHESDDLLDEVFHNNTGETPK